MCTVTYMPLENSVLFTSNRDEQTQRAPAELPETYLYSSGKILFPKDGKESGTWIALHNNGNVMILLNGAFKKHIPHPPYRRSRGLIFLDIFDTEEPKATFENICLDDIEPFTLVIWQHGTLWDARWDGYEKYITPLPAHTPRIWSSVTLYDDEIITRRKMWFAKWQNETTYKTAESIRLFHEFGGDGNEHTNLRMNRNGILQTVSITGIEIMPDKAIMHYKDINAGLVSVNEWYISGLLQNS